MCRNYAKEYLKGVMCLTSAAERCDSESGMNDPDKVPEDKISTPDGSTGNPVDSDNPLEIPGGSTDTDIELEFGSDRYPDETPVVDKIVPTNTDNVATVQYWYKPEGSDEWKPVVDTDEDDQPDVRSNLGTVCTHPIFH